MPDERFGEFLQFVFRAVDRMMIFGQKVHHLARAYVDPFALSKS